MSDSLRDLANIEYGASPKEIRVEYGTPFKIYGSGGLVGYSKVALFGMPLVVVARKGTLDNPIYSEDPCWVIDTAFAVIPKKDIDARWLYYQLSNFDLRKLNEATGVPSISRDFLYRVRFEKLPLPEQKKIAHFLNTVDSVIEKTQSAIDKYKAIKQGMLQDLFTRGIDIKTGKLRPRYEDAPELYKETKLGWIPNEWDEKPLENVTDYVDYRGKTPPKSHFGVFLITARNIKDGYIDYEISKEYIRADAFESAMSRGKVRLGDVLITTEAPLGNVAQIDIENIALAQRVIKYRGFTSVLNNDFLAKFLMSDLFQRQLLAEATGSTVLGIKGSRLHKLIVFIPSIEEQQHIGERIKAFDKILLTEQSHLHKLHLLKSGLMGDLLSGKKRVKVDSEDLTTAS